MPAQRRALLLLIITALLWSGNFVVARATNAAIGPLTLSLSRWFIVTILLLPWVIIRLRQKPLHASQYLRVFIMAVLGVSCYNTFVYIGLQYTSASNGVLFNSTIPFWVLIVQWICFKRPFAWQDMFGLLLSLFGVIILVSHGQWARLMSLEFSHGDIWIIIAAICWGGYTALLPHWRPSQLDVMSYLGLLALMGVGFIFIARVINPFEEPMIQFTTENIASVLYVSIFATIIAWMCFMQGVQIIGAQIGGQSIHLMPVFVAILAFTFLGESLEWYHYLGAGFIFLGLMASNRLTIIKRAIPS